MSARPSVRVVLADDDPDVRTALRLLLEDATGVEVVAEAASAEEATAAVTDLTPDVAVLDVYMPGGGLRALQSIRATRPGTRIVVLTADDTPQTRHDALSNGADRFVVKGDGDDLVNAVRGGAGLAG